jgi:hypothetical protein
MLGWTIEAILIFLGYCVIESRFVCFIVDISSLLRVVVPLPACRQLHNPRTPYVTNHGTLTLQYKNHPASTSINTSVATAAPFSTVSPIIAGTTAATTGRAIHCESSSEEVCLSISCFPLVLRRLSVEERKECRESGRVSEMSDMRELRRRSGDVGVEGRPPSAKVAARFSILWRS